MPSHPRKNGSLFDYALEDVIKADNYRFKLLKNLRKLVLEEYRLENYGSASKYALTYFKLYKRLARDNKGSMYLTTDYKPNPKTDDGSMKIFKHLNPRYLDEVITCYMDCRKFLVGKQGKKLIEQINEYLPAQERWDAFTNYYQIYVADGYKDGDSNYRQTLIKRQNKYIDRLISQYQYLNQWKTVEQYSKFLY